MAQIYFNIPQYISILLNISMSDTPGYVNLSISVTPLNFLLISLLICSFIIILILNSGVILTNKSHVIYIYFLL